MKVYVLIISDCEMRPRCDIITTAVFAKHEDALKAMEDEISDMIDAEQIEDSEVERFKAHDYAVATDGRFVWKIEERNFVPC